MIKGQRDKVAHGLRIGDKISWYLWLRLRTLDVKHNAKPVEATRRDLIFMLQRYVGWGVEKWLWLWWSKKNTDSETVAVVQSGDAGREMDGFGIVLFVSYGQEGLLVDCMWAVSKWGEGESRRACLFLTWVSGDRNRTWGKGKLEHAERHRLWWSGYHGMPFWLSWGMCPEESRTNCWQWTGKEHIWMVFYPDRTTWYSLRRKGWEESWDPQADDRGMPHLGMQRGTGKETEKEQLVSEENLAFVGFRHWEESGSRGKKNSTL